MYTSCTIILFGVTAVSRWLDCRVYVFYRQYLASLQIEPDKLLPEFDSIPDVLVEKCAAISIRPETMKELTSAMHGKLVSIRCVLKGLG